MQQQVEPSISIRLARQLTEMRFCRVRTRQEVRDEITPGRCLRHFQRFAEVGHETKA